MKSAVVCIAKNEDRYLDEWIKYHLKLGFSEIFVYQNNWRYPTGPYDDPRVHLLEMDGYKMMNPCYNGFIQEYHDKFDFVMFIDVDEFLVVNTGEPLDDVLESYLDEDCVYVNWRIFGDNGRKDTSDGEYSCVKRFTRCDDRLHRLANDINRIEGVDTRLRERDFDLLHALLRICHIAHRSGNAENTGLSSCRRRVHRET